MNVKLAKCGGPGPASRMLARARELGFRTFLGCMEETSVGIAASAHVAALADWIDLDGCLLISDDPFEGLELDADCRWQLTDAPGLGIRRLAGRLRCGVSLWTTWWTRSWTNPLPAIRAAIYDGRNGLRHLREGLSAPRLHAARPPASAVERALQTREEEGNHWLIRARPPR